MRLLCDASSLSPLTRCIVDARRSTDEGAEWREHMSVTKTTGPFPADWWKPACGQCDRALLRSVMRWGSPSILHRAEKWQQWDRILTDESGERRFGRWGLARRADSGRRAWHGG